MRFPYRQSIVPLAIALLCVASMLLIEWSLPTLVVPLEIGMADILFVREEGPNLGRRPASDEIVLVLLDTASTKARGGELPAFEDDLRLYQKLIEAGALAIADTRMVAAASEETMAQLRPLLEGMARIGGATPLFRDIWLPASMPRPEFVRWKPQIAPVVADMRPNAFHEFDVRLFPLVVYANGGAVESMPLQIFRRVRDLPQPSSEETEDELEQCRIFMSWRARGNASAIRLQYPPYYRVGPLHIPWYSFESSSTLVPPAGFWVSYDAAPAGFKRISYQRVLEEEPNPRLAGKIIIIGCDAELDMAYQNYNIPNSLKKASMAEVMGAAVQTLREERFLRNAPQWLKLTVALCLVLAVTLSAVHLRPSVALLVTIALIAAYFAFATGAYRSGWLTSLLLVPIATVASGMLGGAYQLLRTRQARARIVDLFGRYVPRAVVQQLIQRSQLEALSVGGRRREVTVLFADIRGFTRFSEQLRPEMVLTELNSLLEGMVACTFEAEGTLDKFIGDAILVLFNAPLEQPDHARRAVGAALNIQRQVAQHPSGLSIGIGIHTGAAVVGNVGTPERMEYTAIGSTVNLASRLCDLARAGEVIVSSEVAGLVEEFFEIEAQPPIRVKGIERQLTLFQVRSPKGEAGGQVSAREPGE
jgi:class 3 adenylate cyclase